MTPSQHLPPVSAQLPGQLRRADPLGDPTHQQHDLRRRIVRPHQDRARQGVETALADLAAVAQQRSPMTLVDVAVLEAVAVRAGQPRRMKQPHQPVVTPLGAQQIRDWEIHFLAPSRSSKLPIRARSSVA